MASFDTVIVGGGIIGCTLARALATAGMRVAVIERGTPGGEASGAAAGMLSPSAEAEKDSPLLSLCRSSLQRYGPLAAELQAETGVDPQYRTEGTFLLFASEQERTERIVSIDWQRSLGIPIEELPSSELCEREPALSAQFGVFYFPNDHQIDNRLLMHALVQSCRLRGVEFILGKAALDVEHNSHRINGVILENGRIAAGRVVNAAGAWAAQLRVPQLAQAPIRPVKGHMLAVQGPPDLLRHVVRSHSVYLVPRSEGRVLVGSTMEEVGFDKTPRAAPLTRLLRAAQQVCPALEQSAIGEFWTGLRPASSDGLPLLGPTELEGYWVALGHFRNGILLAPITAEILSSWLLTGRPSMSVDAFSPFRFTRS